MTRNDLCGGPSLTPPGYYDPPEEDEDDDGYVECSECDMSIRRHQMKNPGCVYCRPEEEEES